MFLLIWFQCNNNSFVKENSVYKAVEVKQTVINTLLIIWSNTIDYENLCCSIDSTEAYSDGFDLVNFLYYLGKTCSDLNYTLLESDVLYSVTIQNAN